jgi:hypothetical protein
MRKDPFAGIPLSEQSATGKLDQRLFAPVPSSVAPAKPERAAAPPSAMPTATQSGYVGEANASKPAGPKFDLDDQPLYKATFAFTQDELEALEDLKLELRRAHDRRVTKNDLIRAGLHQLFEDHRSKGTRSYATRKVTGAKDD